MVRVEVMAEDAVHVDEEGLSLLLLLQKHFVWEEAITTMLKVDWEKLCALRYADFTYRMRKSSKKRSACLKRYGRVGKRLGRILHSRESMKYLHKTGTVRLTVMEQDLLDTQAD
ncbi:hypothetical protein JCGZ_00466 [Jatropha curcas]|uniref:Uncharacterized protein n=1 Tax=Jatropha curcas TaxID=180498 RepID=A0A067JT25_JATCU|nr:hypothetical protein JCGZ_00466 [Jatropha curcas]